MPHSSIYFLFIIYRQQLQFWKSDEEKNDSIYFHTIPEKQQTCYPELSDGVFGPVPSQSRSIKKKVKSKRHRRKKRVKKSTSDCAIGTNLINHGDSLDKSIGNQLDSNIEKLSIVGKSTSKATISTQEIGIVRSRWDSSDSDADTTIATTSQGNPQIPKSPIDGKVTSGVLGMDKLLAKNLSVKHKSKMYSDKRSFKKKRNKRDHKSTSYSDRCLRSPLRKRPNLQQKDTRRASLVSVEEKRFRHNHNSRERSESLEKRSSHSSSISSHSNCSRHRSRKYSNNSISSRSSISVSPRQNSIWSTTESSNDSWSNCNQHKQEQGVNVDEDKVKKSKKKKIGLSWQPPIEFGDDEEENKTENLILKKDLEKVSKYVCLKKDAPLRKDLTPEKTNSTENGVFSMKDITLNKDSPVKEDGTFEESNDAQFHMRNSSPNKEEHVTENTMDLDTIDEMLFTKEKKPTVVRSNRSKQELRKRISLLQKSKEPVVDDSNTYSDSPKKEVNNNNLISPCKISESDNNNVSTHKNDTVKFPGGIKNEVDDLSPALTGFGFIPKYQPRFSPVHRVEVEPSPVHVPVAKLQDVGGIWSDDETDNNKLQHLDSQNLSITVTASSQELFSEPLFKIATNTTSPVECMNHRTESEVTVFESTGEDDELQLHGPLPPPKKPIKFNIKLPKPESSADPVVKGKKKKSKRRKKHKIEEGENLKIKNSITMQLPIKSTDSSVKLSDDTPSLPISKFPASSTNLQVQGVNQNQTSNAMYMRQQMSMYSHQSQFFHPIYHQQYVYQQMQYASAQMQQFMQYTNNNCLPLPMENTSLNSYPPLPTNEELPPLPAESQQPPEPVTDTKRLNDTVVMAMLYADPTDEKLSKLFNNASDDPSLPSPASSRSPSRSRSRSRRKKRGKNKRSNRWRSRSSSTSSSYSSRSSESHHRRSRSSSYDSSRSRLRRHRSYQSYSSSGGSSRSFDSRTYYSSDERTDRRRSRSVLRHSSSSRSLRDRSTSWSSGGSDLDRPCRHFRRRLSRSKQFSETSSRTSRSSWSGRSWSSGRSLSRSRSSSRYSRSSYYSD